MRGTNGHREGLPRRGRVLMVIENEGVPEDRRVWDECRTLVQAGWEVVVVCPHVLDGDRPDAETRGGVEIHRFPLRPAGSALGYFREYALALWRIRRIARRLHEEEPFDVVHASNPPDLLFLAVRSMRARGARFIFDHHDLMPELYRSRYGRTGILYRVLVAIERLTLNQADVVISTNESYRRTAITRGGVSPERVFVVRNGPDLDRFLPVEPDPSLRRGARYLIAYLGVMGPQDGIDHALSALAELRRLRADDWHALFIGEGQVLAEMRDLAANLGVADAVEFAGWREDDDIRRMLSTADVCLAPDPPGPLNDISTMVKVLEYMAIGRPIASYYLPETHVSAGDAAAYAPSADPESLGRCVHDLLEDPARRMEMGRHGHERVAAFSWQRSSAALLAAYEHAITSGPRRGRARPKALASRGVAIPGASDGAGHQLR